VAIRVSLLPLESKILFSNSIGRPILIQYLSRNVKDL
jgi:hypothetical protein